MSDAVLFGLACCILTSVFAYSWITASKSGRNKFWKSQNWVGLRSQWFAPTRAAIDAISTTASLVTEGYEKYSRKGKTWMLPQLPYPLLIVTPTQMTEVLSLPDDRQNSFTPTADIIAGIYTLRNGGPHSPHAELVRGRLSRQLPSLTSAMYEELISTFDDLWGRKTTDWTTIRVSAVMMQAVSRVANRVFAGPELCKNLRFIEHSREFSQQIFQRGGIVAMFPKWSHPYLGPLLTRGAYAHERAATRIAAAIVQDRIAHMRGEIDNSSYEAPNDGLQWLLQMFDTTSKAPNTQDVVHSLLNLNATAIHTTTMVISNTLMDLYTSPDKEEFLLGLREEVDRVFAESGGVVNKELVNRLYRIDSALRESMRMSPLNEVNCRRQIIDPKGVTLADGTHVPHGFTVAVAEAGVHKDSDFYDEPFKYDAFRFSRSKEVGTAQPNGAAKDLRETLQQKNTALFATSPYFLPFGHGKHACPGRFFATMELKLMLAYIIKHYDVEIVGNKRPENVHINGHWAPSDKAEIRVRWRA